MRKVTTMARKPYEASRLAKFLEKRVLELRPHKTQAQIAEEAGFINPNMIAMLKSGSTKLPLDRVPSLAAALECDPRLLFNLALEPLGGDTTVRAIEDIFGVVVKKNEAAWIQELRDVSGNTDPSLTSRGRAAIRGIFGK